MINLSALKANIEHEIGASEQEQTGIFTCTLGLAHLIVEALEQQIQKEKN